MPKEAQIKSMFNQISHSYDLLNDLLSLGIHRLWKKRLVTAITEINPESVLDCATGTGDIAIMIKKELPNCNVSGSDFSPNMLEVAKAKTNEITWSVGDVMKLDAADNSYDCSSISYGIRNVEDYHQALKEMARVTKKRICILEFGQPQNSVFKFFYFTIMHFIMPIVGRLFGKKSAYKYLIDSSEKFPCADDFCNVIQDATGFSQVTFHPFFGGVTYLYIAHNGNLNE